MSNKKRVTLKMHPGKVYEFTEKELIDLRRFGLVERELDDEKAAKAAKPAARAPERKDNTHTVTAPERKDNTKK